MIIFSWLCMKFSYIGGIVQVVPLKTSNIIVNLILPFTFYFQILVIQTIINNTKRNDNFKATHHEFRTHPWKKVLQGFIMTYNVNISESLIQSKIWRLPSIKNLLTCICVALLFSSTYQKRLFSFLLKYISVFFFPLPFSTCQTWFTVWRIAKIASRFPII